MLKRFLVLLLILFSTTSCTYYHNFSAKKGEQRKMSFGGDTIRVFLGASTKWFGRPGTFGAHFSVNSHLNESWPKDSIAFDSVCIRSLDSDYEKCLRLRGQATSNTRSYTVYVDEISVPKIDSFIFSFDAIAIDRNSRKEIRRERFARKFYHSKRTAWFDH